MASAAPSTMPSKKRKTSPVERESSSIDPTLLSDSIAAAQDALRSLSSSSLKKEDTTPTYAPYQSPSTPKVRLYIDLDYVTRSTPADSLPLISHRDETILGAFRLLKYYQNVFDRDESLACNLGVKTLRCEYIERWASENLSPAPAILQKPHPTEPDPQWPAIIHTYLCRPNTAILKPEPREPSHGKLDSSESASAHPSQAAQLWLDNTLISMSAADFQKLEDSRQHGTLSHLPLKPLDEDEQREVAALDILERELREVQRWADEVAALSRQVNWRIGKRKRAIDDRRLAQNVYPGVGLRSMLTNSPKSLQNALTDQIKNGLKATHATKPVDYKEPVVVSKEIYDQVFARINTSAVARAELSGNVTSELAIRDGQSELQVDRVDC